MRSSRPLAAGAFVAAVVILVAIAATATATSARHPTGHGAFVSSVFATGNAITHMTPNGQQTISGPDDITYLNGDIFVGFQNGVGPQGQPSTTGNTDSTIVEFDLQGNPVNQWDVVGKCDGLTADPQLGGVIATVNEDAGSSLYVIDPSSATAAHYSYNEPLPHDGGTDAISIYRGMILISASAPGTTGMTAPQPTYPAVYEVALNSATLVATVQPLFFDEASAKVANRASGKTGKRVTLKLTDPDSSEVVPGFAPRFAGDFMLTSQGDQQQIFVRHAGTKHQSLSVLNLSTSVDDTVWPSDRDGAIYTSDNGANTIYKITGPFHRGKAFVAATPCDSNNAPMTCPGPGFPANYLGELNPVSGAITTVALSDPAVEPQGMLFLP